MSNARKTKNPNGKNNHALHVLRASTPRLPQAIALEGLGPNR